MKHTDSKKKFINLKKQIIYYLAISTMLLPLPVQGEIIPDTNIEIEKQTQVEKAQNGIELVQIATPDDNGISLNNYEKFNIDEKGAILNNSYNMSKTKLSGYIQGNENLAHGQANIIINEITSNTPSDINGTIEIAGQKADVIIANENGINVNNAGFINTAGVTLTTGKIDEQRNINTENMHKSIQINGKGINAKETDYLKILANAIKINAEIHANKAKMQTKGNEENKKEYLFDVTEVGGIYANTIYLVGTEKGLGVNNEGQINAYQEITIDEYGNIRNKGTINAKENIDIKSETYINEENAKTQSKNINIQTKKQVANEGIINGEQTNLATKELSNKGKIYGTEINIKANDLSNIGQKGERPVIASRNNINLEIKNKITNTNHALIRAEKNLIITGNIKEKSKTKEIQNESAYIESGNDININSETIKNINTKITKETVRVKTEKRKEASIQGKKERYQFSEKAEKGKAYITIEKGSYKLTIHHLNTPDGNDSKYFNTYDYDIKTYDDQVKESDPAHIEAGNNIKIKSNEVINDKSEILAGKEIHVKSEKFSNLDEKGKRKITTKGTVTNYWIDRVHHGLDPFTTYPKTATSTTIYTEPDIIEDIKIKVSKNEEHANIDKNNKEKAKPLEINGLFDITKNPKATYIIETDENYTNKRKYLSSDYFIEKMKYNPIQIEKRLGDGYYEQKLIREEMLKNQRKNITENEYRQMMDNAIEYAKENKDLKIGIKLTKEQQQNLKQDIIWLEETSVLLPNGQIVKALVPKIYLAKNNLNNKQNTLNKDYQSIISANNVKFELTEDLINKGQIIAKENIQILAKNIYNEKGEINGKQIKLKSNENIENSGTIIAKKEIQLASGKNINIFSPIYSAENEKGKIKNLTSKASVIVTEDNGKITLNSEKDINIKAADIHSKGTTTLTAKENINLKTENIQKEFTTTWDVENKRKEKTEIDIGTNITSKGNIQVQAGKNINAKAAQIFTQEKLTMKANENINIENGNYVNELDEKHHHEVNGLFGLYTEHEETTNDQVKTKQAISSTVIAKETSIESGNDINIKGTNILSKADIQIKAKKDINITNIKETNEEKHEKYEKETGIFAENNGIFIGSKKENYELKLENEKDKENTIASEKGKIQIESNNKTLIKSTNMYAKENIDIKGKETKIKGIEEKTKIHETHTYTQSGIGITLGGQTVNTINTIKTPIEKTINDKNGKLKTLHAIQSGYAIYDEKENLKKLKNIEDIKESIGINLSIGTTKQTQTTKTENITNKQSEIQTKENINIQSNEKDTTIETSNLSAKEIHINSNKNINITSKENTTTRETKTKNENKQIGAAVGIQGVQGINLSYMKNKGNEKEIVQTHTMSRFNANKINLKSNKDTNITQSEIKADKVQISAENLNLESKQDTKTNKETQNNVNIGIDIDMHKNINIKSGIGNQKIESTYKAVTTQAGIYAGKDGYDINVKNKTKLTGSTIQSKANKDKNNLVTGTLEYKHIQNKAEYKTDGQGININTDKKGKLNEKGITPQIQPSLNKKETNETKTTIQNANIQIQDKENQKQDIQEIQTNVETKLETLKEIYNKAEIEEQKEMIKTLQEIGNKTIHKIAQKNGWKEGSKEKLLMHTALGAIEGKLTGNTATGAIAGSLNEAIISKIEKEKGKQWIKDHPDTLQWISYLIGETVDQVTKGKTGKQTAVAGTKWNLLYEELEERSKKERQKIYEEIQKLYLKEVLKDNTLNYEDLSLKEKSYYWITKGVDALLSGENLSVAKYILNGQLHGFPKEDIEYQVSLPYIKNGENKELKFITFGNNSMLYKDLQNALPRIFFDCCHDLDIYKTQNTKWIKGEYLNKFRDHALGINGVQIILTSVNNEISDIKSEYSFLITFMDLIDYDKNKEGFNRAGAALHVEPVAWKVSIPFKLIQNDLGYLDFKYFER